MATRRIISNEDGLSSAPSIVTSRAIQYTDFDLTFSTKPRQELRDSSGGPVIGYLEGDIYKKYDAGAVLQAVKTIIMTDRVEKPFQPRFGGGLHGLLFELNDIVTRNQVINGIRNSIEAYEPRVSVLTVAIDPSGIDYNEFALTVEIQIKNTLETVTFTTNLNRLR